MPNLAIEGENAAEVPANRHIAISLQALCKRFQLYTRPFDRVRQAFAANGQEYFDAVWALKSLTFDVQRGETFGIIGSNGSGKSTLLSVLCSTISPTSGKFAVNGKVAALLELGAGFNPLFTGRENIYLNGSLWGLTREQIDARFDQIAAFADIGDFLERPVKTYSSGMTVRLAFAIAAHVDAEILIIDEALAVGDALFTQKCIRFLHQFRKHGTLLFVSHELGSVINLCDRVLWLEKGEQRMIGDARTVCESYIAHLFKEQAQASKASRLPTTEVATTAVAQSTVEQDFDQSIRKSDHDYEGGEGQIVSVMLQKPTGERLLTASADDQLVLVVTCKALRPMFSPLVGFFVKDVVGQALFGENTGEAMLSRPLSLEAGERFTVRFRFALPTLVAGDYTVCVAFAEGNQHDFVQHHWIHDALVFKVHELARHRGLVGIPVQVEINTK